MLEEKRLYEFCFDFGLTIRDSLTLASFQYYQSIGQPLSPNTVTDFYKMAAKFCNFDPLELPFTEMGNFTQQFSDALVRHIHEDS